MQQTPQSTRQEIGERIGGVMWSTAIMAGILQVFLGLLLISDPGMTTLVLIQFLGLYWLVLGVISIIEIFTRESGVPWGWLLFSGILGIIAGLFVLRHPIFGAFVSLLFLVYLIVFTGIIRGIISLVKGIRRGGVWGGETWNIISGITLILISLYLLFNPFGALISLPVVIGILFLIGGVALVILGTEIKRKCCSPLRV